ncbi:DsbA family oxidoreductase [Acidovorax sp. PRC11]|uniref:DsbA family oxidoreductase n=3 Tax=Bacteria TaxID=2 RepID=UPI002881426A|nr:DsbA family oxidoreductase [Acidovorax sp. PRC11]MDT0138309.1 DsbA family oxidoreductase [Acidovorax sp. PRC11]
MTDTVSAAATPADAAVPLRIDFVSDISCPWCAIGLQSLDRALQSLGGAVQAEVHFQPFELNPGMPAGGQDIGEHLAEKYGATAEQTVQTQRAIAERGAALGFEFRMDRRSRIYNTFDAHRLLHWAQETAGPQGQAKLKRALFHAYFTEGRDPGDRALLAELAAGAGLDAARAQEVLDSDEYADAVREREAFYQQHGIHSVPAVIVNERHLIQGGQPPEVFEQALRRIAAQG